MWTDFLRFTFKEEIIKEKIGRLDSMKTERMTGKSGEDIYSVHGKHRIISNSL